MGPTCLDTSNKRGQKKYFNFKIILLSIIITGLGMRLFRLDYQGFWYDETESVYAANEYNFLDIWESEEAKSPFYYLFILRPWIKIFGISEYSARFPSVVFGTASIFLIYKIGVLVFGPLVGLFSAFLLAISPFSIYYSQEANCSSIIIPSVLLSMFLFFRFLNQKSGLFSLTLINALLIYIHPSCFFTIIIQNMALFFLDTKKLLKKWLFFQTVIFISLGLWLFVFYRLDRLSRITYWTEQVNLMTVFRTFENFSHGVYRFALGGSGFSVSGKYLILPRVNLVIYSLLVIYGLAILKRISDRRWGVTIILFWLFIPILSSYIFSSMFFPVYADRYIMYCLPAYYILIAIGFSNIRLRKLRITLIIAISFLNIFALRILYDPSITQITKNDSWREIGSNVRGLIKPNDIIILSPLRQIGPFWYYYKPENRTNRKIDAIGSEMNEQWQSVYQDDNEVLIMGPALGEAEKFINKFRKEFERVNRIWLILSPSWPGQKDSGKYLINYFSLYFTLKEFKQYTFPGVDVYEFKK